MKVHPDSIVYADEPKSRKWNYEQGLMLEAFYQLWKQSGDDKYLQYIIKNLDHYITPDGTILTYKASEFNIDNITPGKVVVRMYELTKEKKYKIAAETLRSQLAKHPRTSEGGFWHKKIYPNQMWLDGLYMGEPFYAKYAQAFNEPKDFDDITNQFLLIHKHAYDSKTGLYFHAWDATKEQKWANPQTGCSPNLWSRSLGWFAMALVDVLEILPEAHPKRQELLTIFQKYCTNILKQRDADSLLWYQVTDQQRRKGNYLEASGSAMFIYAFAKGANLGYLDASFRNEAGKSFDALTKKLVTVDERGMIFLHNVCKVSGLGGKPYRDGSYEYYISEPRRVNDFKGYGPFLLAAIELEKQ